MCAPAASWRKGTRRMPCSPSAASSGSISGDGRPKTKRTPSLARQRASSRPPFSSAIGHLLVGLAALVAALARAGPGVPSGVPRAGIVMPMTYGRDVDWARNIVRARKCELDRMGGRVTLRNPRIVGFDHARGRLPAALRAFFRAADVPGYVLADT